MCSRFTEIFDIHTPWENCQSNSSLPLPSLRTSGDTFRSSTVTIESDATPKEANSLTNVRSKSSTYIYQTQSFSAPMSLTEDVTVRISTKQQLTSKLKRFLTTIGKSKRDRRAEKSN
ncbi:hypothetical protein BD770DRAFT_386876 [Pilaira anomala]|nr:hypothetical protein BD770DRAFT_386876 [Pilaira anomala]